jgi:AraC-like DNA-binding protein
LFRCTIIYDAPSTVVTLARADMDLPQSSSDPPLIAHLERHADALDERLPVNPTFTSNVRRALTAGLANGDVGLEVVARSLGVSSRTAQRRLLAEATTHQRVLDELRRDLAVRYFDENSMGIQEVAFVLGFSDQSAFNHAFKRWTGTSPSAYRKRVRPP